LSESGYLFPKTIAKDLTTKAELSMETTTLDVLLQNVFPHETNAPELSSFVGTHV
jgi:hypothetical protein